MELLTREMVNVLSDEKKSKRYYSRSHIFVAIAFALILYGIFYLISEILQYLPERPISYLLLWSIFRAILAIIIIYIGVSVLMMVRKSDKSTFSASLRQILAGRKWIVTLSILTLVLLLLTDESTLTFRPPPGSMSFKYRLYYGWETNPPTYSWLYSEGFRGGGYIEIWEDRWYGCSPNRIVLSIQESIYGWVVVPQWIKFGLYLMGGPATGLISLGYIENGVYEFHIVMIDAIDVFTIHKTHDSFYVEATPLVKYCVRVGATIS